MPNLPFTLGPDEVIVRRLPDFGPCIVAGSNAHLRPGDLWHLHRDEIPLRADFEVVEPVPPAKGGRSADA